jgi:arylsulfatase A-like enzyme
MNLRFSLLALTAGLVLHAAAAAESRPNIVLIYADDLGYGDLSCYGATKIQTPNLDRLAAAGRRFTDAHTTSATCTPSRFALLTGRYPWRRSDAKILPGDARALIAPGTPTLASALKSAGYTTSVVGKWHLGLGDATLDWNQEIKPGPLEIGFDSCFLLPATGDRVPCVYVENHRVVGLDRNDPITVDYSKPIGNEPTGKKNPELLKYRPSHGHDMAIVNGISRIGYMTGGTSALWVDEDMADVFVKRSVQFIEQNRTKPFFLFLSTHDIHVPRLPHSRFAGKSGMGYRGDAILQFDWTVGEIMAALDRLKIAENTIVIVSSDNGAVVDDGYQDGAVEKLNGHTPNSSLRGGKYSAFEAGTRVPLIVRWPARIKPGVSSALVSQVDFPATFAKLTGQTPPAGSFPDSRNAADALFGSDTTRGRDHVVQHALNGRLGIRNAEWKYISPGPGPARNPNTHIELGNSLQPQLYHLKADPGETKNLAAEHPDKVEELKALLAQAQAG